MISVDEAVKSLNCKVCRLELLDPMVTGAEVHHLSKYFDVGINHVNTLRKIGTSIPKPLIQRMREDIEVREVKRDRE